VQRAPGRLEKLQLDVALAQTIHMHAHAPTPARGAARLQQVRR